MASKKQVHFVSIWWRPMEAMASLRWTLVSIVATSSAAAETHVMGWFAAQGRFIEESRAFSLEDVNDAEIQEG